MSHTLPELPYEFSALEPHIDAKTMEIHHGKHHAGYVAKLNDALEGYDDLKTENVEDLMRNLNNMPVEISEAVRNNGGGHANHTLFWSIMSPDGGGEPEGELADKIKETFGSFADFKTKFSEEATKRFGSGWAWLVVEPDSKIHICSTQNQDTPLMKGNTPILGLDVWEHAYYLNYQNKRADYIDAWWNVINWHEVQNRFADAKRSE